MTQVPLDDALDAAFAILRAHLPTFDDTAELSDAPEALRDLLYRDWYCAVGEKPSAGLEHRDLAEMLRAAHAHSARWEDGWRVEKLSPRGRVVFTRGQERRIGHVIDCLPREASTLSLRPGDMVSVVARRCSESLNPGDWVTFSDTWHAGRKNPLLRIYWNIHPAGAANLVELLTSDLPDPLPYYFKCPRFPVEFDRRDAAVLYLPRVAFSTAAPVLAHTARMLESHLGATVPALTKEIAQGVGLAEDPTAEDESFGSARCALLARAISACLCEGGEEPQVWKAAVHVAFNRLGIPTDRPWLETETSPDYALP